MRFYQTLTKFLIKEIMMKKILFVAASLQVGGMERVLTDIANALVKRDFDVTIVTYMDSGVANWCGELDKRVNFIYKKPKDFRLRKKLPYVHRFYRPGKWETRTSAKALYNYYVGSKNKYDVEIAFCRGPAVKIVSGSTNKNSKKFTWVHNDYSLVDPKTITKFFNNMDEAKEAYSKFDKIVSVSDEAKDKFIEVIGYREKLQTIYNLLSIEKIIEKSKCVCPEIKTKFTIISVARIIPAKGYHTLLKAVKRLNDDGLDFELWLVGTRYGDEYDNQLDEYINENKLTNVKLLGRQINPYCFMSQADLYICSSWREGFSISVAEAIACGLPVITTNCTGPVEILDNGKYGIIINYDEEEMYLSLKDAILNPQKLEEYKEKAFVRSKYFSDESIIKQIIDLF